VPHASSKHINFTRSKVPTAMLWKIYIFRDVMMCRVMNSWRSFIFLTQYCAGGKIEKNEMGWTGSAYGRGEAYTGFWWETWGERGHLGDPGVDGRIILNWIFRKWDMGVRTRSIWLRIGTGGGHL